MSYVTSSYHICHIILSYMSHHLQAKPRIGAFEVTLVWSHNSFSYRVLLYSKLSSRFSLSVCHVFSFFKKN